MLLDTITPGLVPILCHPCKPGYTTKGRGAKECVEIDKKDDDNSDDNNTDDTNMCPEGTEWVEDDKAKGCRALCSLGTYSDNGTEPCRRCASGTITTSPGSTRCTTDPSLDPANEKEACPDGQMRVYHDRSSKCLPECKVGEYSRTGAVPCRNCPEGYKTDGRRYHLRQ